MSKDEEGKDEPDSLPRVQFRPFSDSSEGLHKSKSLVANNARSIISKNELASQLILDDNESDFPCLAMASSAPENPFMSVKAVSFTPSFQLSSSIQSGKP